MSSVIYFPMWVGLTSNVEIFSINPADGSNLRQLTFDTNEYFWCTVSPDGNLILVGGGTTIPGQVWILRTDGSVVRELTNLLASALVGDMQGDWSPDGSQVVLTGTQYDASLGEGSAKMDLQIVNVDNSGYTPVVLSEKVTAYANASIYWSPDGTKFLFPTEVGDYPTDGYGRINVVSCNIDGSGSRRLLDAAADMTHPLTYLPWGWYSDSTHIAAAARTTDYTNQSVVKTDGTTTTTLYSDTTFAYLNIFTSCGAISPDNTAIAWNSPHDNGIVVLRDGVARNYAVPYTTSDQGISWTPGGGHALTWSATGLPAGVTIDASTGVISGSPTDATADYPSVIVTATDTVSGCTASTTFDWLITIIVTVDPVTNQIVTAPHVVNLPMTGHDSAGDALTWSATGLPASLSINASTGVITGTLVDSDASTTPYNTVVTATDSVHTAFSASRTFAWLVSLPAPVVTSVTASSGSAGGGETVTIIGQHFTSDSTVRFGTVAGTAVTYISSTQLTAVSPAEAVGTVDVTVSTPYGTSATSTADHYTYVLPVTGTIAFCMTVGSTQQIHTMTSAGVTQLTTGATNWNWCRWSKDGNFLLAADTDGALWVLNADGSPVRQLTNLVASSPTGFWQGDWSPDGSQVVVIVPSTGTGGSAKADLQIVNVDNSGHTVITLTEKMTLYADSIVSWSPDGTKFVFPSMLGDFGTAGYGQLNAVVCNIDGSGSHRILDASPAAYVMRYVPWGWYSDSQHVLVAQQDDVSGVRTDGRNRLLKSDGTTTVVLYEERQEIYLDPVACLGALCPADEASIAWNSFSGTAMVIRTAAGVIHAFGQPNSMSTDGMTWKA